MKQEAMRQRGGNPVTPVEYRYLTEFQSHEPEFDYLKSLEIEEKINTLRWCHQGANSARFLISTNDKTIKLWKVFEKQMQCVSNFNLDAHAKANGAAGGGGGSALGPNTPGKSSSAPDSPASVTGGEGVGAGANGDGVGFGYSSGFSGKLKLPSVESTDVVFSARCRRLYSNAHAYHINSLSVRLQRQHRNGGAFFFFEGGGV